MAVKVAQLEVKEGREKDDGLRAVGDLCCL
jgi:hypothetical protein